MSAIQSTVMRPEFTLVREGRKTSAPSVKHSHMPEIGYFSEVVNAGYSAISNLQSESAENFWLLMPKHTVFAALRHALKGSWWESKSLRDYRFELQISRQIATLREMQLIIASIDQYGHTQLTFENPIERELPNYGYAFDRLHVFEQETEGWDGAGGLPASPAVAKEVRKFLLAAQKLSLQVPSLAMGGDGSVAVIWTDQEFYISADFDGADDYSFFISEGDDFIDDGVCASDKLDDRLATYLKKHFTDDLHQNL